MGMFPICSKCRMPIYDDQHECSFPTGEICGECWTEKSKTGECNCE